MSVGRIVERTPLLLPLSLSLSFFTNHSLTLPPVKAGALEHARAQTWTAPKDPRVVGGCNHDLDAPWHRRTAHQTDAEAALFIASEVVLDATDQDAWAHENCKSWHAGPGSCLDESKASYCDIPAGQADGIDEGIMLALMGFPIRFGNAGVK